MLRQFARRIPIRFAAAGAAGGSLAARLDGRRPLAFFSSAGGGSGSTGTGGNDDPVARFQTLFAEARDEIEYAREDAETTYFNESVQAAKAAVDAALSAWAEALNNAPDDNARNALVRGSGLKVEQLKAELQALDEIHA